MRLLIGLVVVLWSMSLGAAEEPFVLVCNAVNKWGFNEETSHQIDPAKNTVDSSPALKITDAVISWKFPNWPEVTLYVNRYTGEYQKTLFEPQKKGEALSWGKCKKGTRKF